MAKTGEINLPPACYGLDTELIELFKEVKEACNEQLTPVNDLLDLAKVESGRLELEATSFHMVDLHVGRIWVKSADGTGSTFCFTLPLGRNSWRN